ncbi:hypothetical protein D5086_012873 [Populus alba]|uniref:Uncharacterized protein n=1 Tax=Populus alba TaxID=43335 RepID=A0ACC4C3M8_POPAL
MSKKRRAEVQENSKTADISHSSSSLKSSTERLLRSFSMPADAHAAANARGRMDTLKVMAGKRPVMTYEAHLTLASMGYGIRF